MNEVLKCLAARRSVRKYSGVPVTDEQIQCILQAGLLSASSKNRKPWEMIVVRDKDMLEKMSHCRVGSAKMLAGADCAILVLGDENKAEVWIEDTSIVMSNMHLMADALGLGSCWIQNRLRDAEDGTQSTEAYLRSLLGFPEHLHAEAILSVGCPEAKGAPTDLDALPYDKVHYGKY